MSGINRESWDSDRDAIILLYHGVTDAKPQGIENFSGKHIAVEKFEAQMSWLTKHANPLSLREMAMRLQRGESLPSRSVAITFDDTFLNNRSVALPILERHHLPATFFISTGFIGQKRLFWTDKIEAVVNFTTIKEITLSLPSEANRNWPLRSPSEKIKAVLEIKGAMKLMEPVLRDQLIADLFTACGLTETDIPDDISNYQTLDWDDVRALDEGLCEVGGHTVNHEILAYLPERELKAEINGCLDALSVGLGHQVDLFSYPEGQANHYNDAAIGELKKAGVVVSPSAIRGANRPGDDPFHLRRIMVGFMGEPFPWDDV